MPATRTELQKAADSVEVARSNVEKWAGRRAAVQAELAVLTDGAADTLLDSPDAAERLPRQMRDLRDQVDAADTAVARARERLEAAERHALEVEAADWDAKAEQAQRHADAHAARVAALLQQLQDLDGATYTVGASEAVIAAGIHQPMPLQDVLRPVSEGQRLQQVAARLRIRAAIIRWHLAGETQRPAVATHDGRQVHWNSGMWAPLELFIQPGDVPESIRAVWATPAVRAA